jgi:DNA-binding response OmpR family regulator
VAQLLRVPDDAEIRRPLMRALHELGHVITSLSTGLNGLPEIVATPPDLVILDSALIGNVFRHTRRGRRASR